MNAALPPRLAALYRDARRRAAAIRVLFIAPLIAALGLAIYRFGGRKASIAAATLALLAAAPRIRHAVRRYTLSWLERRLNSLVPTFEDSVDLLVRGPTAAMPGSLPALQVARLQLRLQNVDLPDLRSPYPRRALLLTWGGAVLMAVGALYSPWLWQQLRTLSSEHTAAAPTASVTAHLAVQPPTYTGLTAQSLDTLDAKVPEGSTVTFTFHLQSHVKSAALLFHDGSRLDLRADGDTWRGERVFATSTLYRLVQDGATAAATLHRLDVIPDRPPEVIVRAPDHTLNLLVSGQKTWELIFEATDDYGISAAQLSISHAQGSGENIKTTQQTLAIEGQGDAHHRTYRKTLDLAGLGFTEGDDLIVRLRVTDNRPGQPNVTQSASFILRWPAQAETATVSTPNGSPGVPMSSAWNKKCYA
jgi:hypothetical protein